MLFIHTLTSADMLDHYIFKNFKGLEDFKVMGFV